MLAIIFFAYFYISIVMKPDDIADNFRKSGSFIPGIRPGKRTSDFINDILTRITLVGALYLIAITMVPTFLLSGIRFDKCFSSAGSLKLCRHGPRTEWGSTSTLAALSFDRGRRGHGHRQPDRIAVDHGAITTAFLLVPAAFAEGKPGRCRLCKGAGKGTEMESKTVPGPICCWARRAWAKGTQAKELVKIWAFRRSPPRPAAGQCGQGHFAGQGGQGNHAAG